VLVAYGWDRMETRAAEFVALLLLAAVGMDLMAVANSFVSLFVALELFSITLYAMCAFDLESRFSLESALKYLVLGSIGSASCSTGGVPVRRDGVVPLRRDRHGARGRRR
jgi:NADH-quinone oxidoreductase subunit N